MADKLFMRRWISEDTTPTLPTGCGKCWFFTGKTKDKKALFEHADRGCNCKCHKRRREK